VARGGYREGQSDVDVAIVVRAASRGTLSKVSNAIQLVRYAARIESMILVADEIAPAVDVFPLLYDDIRRHHVVLCGSDPFEGLEIPRRHMRLRIEQELREAQIRLRRAVVDGLGAPRAIAGVVIRKAKQSRVALSALLGLHGVSCNDRTHLVLAKAGELYRVETSAILRAHETPDPALDQLIGLLAAAIDDVDAMEEP
jgi:predicted nucleotidyltransferase